MEDEDITNRRFKIKREEVRSYGTTAGCRGCARAMTESKISVNHSDACRKRWEEKLIRDGDPRITRRAERMPMHTRRRKHNSKQQHGQPTTTKENNTNKIRRR